jgi:hypothetical protein
MLLPLASQSVSKSQSIGSATVHRNLVLKFIIAAAAAGLSSLIASEMDIMKLFGRVFTPGIPNGSSGGEEPAVTPMVSQTPVLTPPAESSAMPPTPTAVKIRDLIQIARN